MSKPARIRTVELLRWYDAQRRDLPWRGLQDPYAVWISEVMLQQTRVETVIPYFLRWMARFPTVRALADAPEDDVLRLWAGLGYYSRARNLQRAARDVVERHGGRLPSDAETLRTLPGVGAYTAGAVASIAFGRRVPAVDGNVLRVLARLTVHEGDILRPAVRRELETVAATLVPTKRAGDWNQALMELGATVCTPRAPRCDACPLHTACGALAEGRTTDLPRRGRAATPREESLRFALVHREDQILLVPGQAKGLLAGLWALPGGAGDAPLGELVTAQSGVRVAVSDTAATAQHRFTHRLWHMTVHPAEAIGGDVLAPARWVPVDRLSDEAVSTAHRKAIAAGRAARDRSFL